MWSAARQLLTLEKKSVLNSSLLAVQPGGNKPPLFLVHGVGGGMLWGYSNLARHLGPDQPVYAFRPRESGGEQGPTTIEKLASRYAADLCRFQPSGPYHLGGYCFGGNVAYEMAQQLTAQGQRVALVLLINSWPYNSGYSRFRWTPPFLIRFATNLGVRLTDQLRLGARRPGEFFKARLIWLRRRSKALLLPSLENRLDVFGTFEFPVQPACERRLWRAHVQAWMQYQPRPYAGRVVLFRTRGHPLLCSFDEDMGWGKFATAGVSAIVCRGDHQSILEEENVGHTARQLKRILAEVRENAAEAVKLSPVREQLQIPDRSAYAPEACKIAKTSILGL